MIATANEAEALKRQAGVKATGRRSTRVVYAFSLSWHPDEAPRLDRAEMLRAADSALAAIDAAHLQCIIVCHSDQPHPHVHCVVNRVDPPTAVWPCSAKIGRRSVGTSLEPTPASETTPVNLQLEAWTTRC